MTLPIDGRSALMDVATELYGRLPKDFVAARNGRAQQAKAAGDQAAADQIKALRRPSTSAWLANLLVRRSAKEVAELLELGAALRTAQQELAADEMRALTRQRRAVISAMVARARSLATEADQAVSDSVARELEGTLHAALTDERAAATFAAGCLDVALRADASVGLIPTAGQVFRPQSPDAGKRSVSSLDEARARQELRQARAALEEAESAVAARTSALEEATTDELAAGKRIEQLSRELERTRQDQSAAHRRTAEAAKAQQKAERNLQRARGRLERAEATAQE